jgi:hypothetical protein
LRREKIDLALMGLPVNELFRNANHWVNSFDKQDWLLVLIAAVAIGFLLLQGFGSRKNY